MKFKAHPWHGIDTFANDNGVVNAFIEIVPTDMVKYEIHKESGYLMIDRPQKFSNIVPSLYGFIPRTYCAEEIAEYCRIKTGRKGIIGDGDPIDICVFTEKTVSHGDFIARSLVIGGLRMIDNNEADDKIIAVLANDPVYKWKDISECPEAFVKKLKHYFLTYKQIPDENSTVICEIPHIYGAEEAMEVIKKSQADYLKHYEG